MFLVFFVVAPDTINNHVKTCREEQKSLHFFAPEYGGKTAFKLILESFQCTYVKMTVQFVLFLHPLQLLPVSLQLWTSIPLECAP